MHRTAVKEAPRSTAEVGGWFANAASKLWRRFGDALAALWATLLGGRYGAGAVHTDDRYLSADAVALASILHLHVKRRNVKYDGNGQWRAAQFFLFFGGFRSSECEEASTPHQPRQMSTRGGLGP